VVGVAERDSWAVMDGSTRKVDAEDARLATTALLTPGTTSVRARQGLRPGPGNPGLVTASGTPDINVNVEKFQAVLTATRGLGEYIATLDADKTINVLGDNPAHGTQQRNHLIIALQTDTYYTDGSTEFEVIEVIGAAGSGDPSLAAYDDYILLARLRITAGATTVTSAMIDDLRPAWFVALGGLLPVKDNVERDALTAWDGLQIYRRDRDWVEIRDGSAWRVQGVAVCTSTADRDAAITHPYNGQIAVTTDLGIVWRRHAGAWGTLNNNAGTTLDTKEDTSGTTTSGAFTATLTGGTTCSGTFVAPASGKVDVIYSAQVGNSDANDLAICSYEVREGAVVGSGTVVQAAEIPRGLYSGTTKRATVVESVSGLTAGGTYNARLMYVVTGDTGTFANKQLKVRPVA
jgi:hypothetical protein